MSIKERKQNLKTYYQRLPELVLKLPLHERQKAYFQDLLNAAKPVKIVPAVMYWRITNWTTYGT